MSYPILITGPARSGTSLVAGIVNHCGAFGGNLTPPNPNNRKGQFENTTIREKAVKPILKKLQLDPLCQKPLPEDEHLKVFKNYALPFRLSVDQIIRSQGYKKDVWFYKGAKMVLMWTLWGVAYPEARWIYVKRNTDDIVNSCMKTSFMRKRNSKEEWRDWVNVHLNRLDQMIESGIRVEIIIPEEIISGNFSRIKNVLKDFNLVWNDNAIKKFVSPRLWGGMVSNG